MTCMMYLSTYMYPLLPGLCLSQVFSTNGAIKKSFLLSVVKVGEVCTCRRPLESMVG